MRRRDVIIKIICIAILFFLSDFCSAQNPHLDSIKRVLPSAKDDSLKVRMLLELSFQQEDSTERLKLLRQGIAIGEKIKSEGCIALCEARIGYFYEFISIDYPKATYWATRALKRSNENNIRTMIAQCDQQLGIISMVFEDFSTALSYFKEAAVINEALANYRSLHTNYEMMGSVKSDLKQFDSAMYYYRKTEKIDLEHGLSVAVVYVNMAGCFINLDQPDSCRKYITLFDLAYKKAGRTYGTHWVDLLTGELELYLNRPETAMPFLLRSYGFADSTSDDELLEQLLPLMAKCYSKLGKFKEAFLADERLIRFRDSIAGNSQTTRVLAIQKKFEEEQMMEISKLKAERAERDHQEEIHSRNRVIGGAGIFLLISVCFGVYIYRGYKAKQRANEIISHQKEIVEEKQKEILDSIRYAQRIQQSLLPTEKYIDKQLKKQNKN